MSELPGGNRLSTAQSAYLRQHAHNPVDWWPWGSAAFAEARRREVPVFLSIGYSACHWCHVMAAESFEDPEVAAQLNEHFVCIKVDREEHPDVDEAYMAATQAMTGQGGWPMSVFTTGDGQVFHAGTYFPPRRMGQVPSFTEVLAAVQEAWTARRDQVHEQAAKISQALGQQRRRQSQMATVVQTDDDADPTALDAEHYARLSEQALAALVEQEDPVHGGFGAAPKFPPSPLLDWLLEESAWAQREQDTDRAGGLAQHTMESMARSALFDQVEGGFCRYATDRAWMLPHFEKMLYDNAQLLGAFARLSRHPAANQHTREAAERTARMTIGWLQHRMLTTEGLLASSLDADTVYEDGTHMEGGTYLFSDEELTEAALAVGLDAAGAERFAELNRGVPADEHALRSGEPMRIADSTPRTIHFEEPPTGADARCWETVLPELRRRRARRPQPARDDKVVAAWNAQAVRSLAEAAALWDDPEVLRFAEALAERLWESHTVPVDPAGTQVRRTSYAGVAGQTIGTLADHAHLVSACFALAGAGARAQQWIDRGASVLRYALSEFVDTDDAAARVLDSLDDEGLLSGAQDGSVDATPVDGPEPSSIASLAQALQTAEALGVAMELPGSLTPQDLLHHLPVIAAKAPVAVGGSLLAAGRAVRGSPALRIFAGSPQDVAEARRQGIRYGIAVEPVQDSALESGAALTVSICLNSAAQPMCLAPRSSVEAAVREVSPAART